ncbi:Pre-mRNA-splicing helicase BRR2 [Spathaspora sp. JA1]|nr:Pre-mRNA-splicing helicase BRR2 [Spathaspora sp. JA1]
MANKVIRQPRKGTTEPETSALSIAGRINENTALPSDQLFEAFMTKIRSYLPDSSHEVIRSASELSMECLNQVDVSVLDKRQELEELLSVKLSDVDLNELITLADKMREVNSVKSEENEDEYVAVDFEEEEEEPELEEELEEEEDDREEEDSEVQLMVEEPEEKLVYNIDWLEEEISQATKTHSFITSEELLLSQTIQFLSNTDLDINELDNSLNEIFEYECSELIIKCIENRWRIVFTKKLADSSTPDERQDIYEEMERLELYQLLAELQDNKRVADDDTEEISTKRTKPTKRVPQRISLDKLVFSTSVEGTKITLPKGTFQENRKSYDIITIPPLEQQPTQADELLSTTVLPEWAQNAFPSAETTSFNRIQSKIFPQAFETDNNLLICAPTGAGKTNVAMLTILRTIENFRVQEKILINQFKIVYIAPLKALVQEQMREFQRRLSNFGIVVNELTGDSTLSQRQISQTQVIVTTPEKWDIITRKDPSYINLVRLVIIDEIHLLHDERGVALENIVCRTLRKAEPTRLVGLSATLPNYTDVAKFIQVPPEGLFYFDASYRPCPLKQEFIGIKERSAIKKLNAMNEACLDKTVENLDSGHQLIIFVHSRRETFTTAKYLSEKITREVSLGVQEILKQEAESITNKHLKELIPHGFGIHHAGLSRNDRSLVEDLFAQGHLRVLVSTATLAWGVNLPAHTVIIKGTETYSPELGTWVQLSPQDILQMLGRAGRPRYDKNGEGVIITSQDEIQYYLAILNQQLPIESKLISKLVDSVNAEVVSGAITSLEEGIEWLSFSYFFVRMVQSPALYGVEAGYDFKTDPSLYNRRSDLIYTALSILHENKLVIFDGKDTVKSTELGKISAYYYINHETINLYGKMLKPYDTEIDILRVFSNSGEFKYVPVRQEERLEVKKLMEKCPIPIKEQPHESVSKINILLQTYISRLTLEGYALISDMIYITQSASRLFRAIYEICILKKWSRVSKLVLELCKMVDQRMWLNNSPLRQFGKLVPSDIVRTSEMSHLPWNRYFQLSVEELAESINLTGNNAKLTHEYIESFPKVNIQYSVQPINDKFLRVQIEALPEWNWIKSVHGNQETFMVFLEDCNGNQLLQIEEFVVRPQNINKVHVVEFIVKWLNQPLVPNYLLSFISNKWVNCTWKTPIMLNTVQVPSIGSYYLDNSDVQLVPTKELSKEHVDIFPFKFFNKVQSATFDSVYNTNENVFVGSSKGDGKTVIAELAVLTHWKRNRGRMVYINPSDEIIDQKLNHWMKKFEVFEKNIGKLTGTLSQDASILNESHVILATPDQFLNLSKRWKTQKSFKSIDLIILDDLHLVGSLANYEILICKLRMLTSQWVTPFRIIALSNPVVNCRDLCDWIGVSKSNIFNFPPQSRQNAISEIKLSVDKTLSKIYKELNKLNVGLRKSVVFVSSRTKALEFARGFDFHDSLRRIDLMKLEKYLTKIEDLTLRELITQGIAIYHENMSSIDRLIVEKLFESNFISVLIATKQTCKYSPVAHNVLIVGTQTYDGYEHRNVDYNSQEIFEMIGCCQDELTNEGKVYIYTENKTIEFYGSILNDGLIVESYLLGSIKELFIGVIATGLVQSKQDCIDILTFSYFYRRLYKNPTFYELNDTSSLGVSEYLSELIETVMDEFIKEEFVEEDEDAILPLNKTIIASHYSVKYDTMKLFGNNLTNKSKLKDMLLIITSGSEFENIPITEHDQNILGQLARKLPIQIQQIESPFDKSFILLQSHISRIDLPLDMIRDRNTVVTKVLDILNACIDYLSGEGHLNSLLAMDISQMIIQACWSNAPNSTLRQIPHFSESIIERCAKHKVETVYDIMSLEDEERDEILQLSPGKELNSIANFVNQYPNIEINYQLQGDCLVNEPKEITINIERDEEMESLEVVADRFPQVKLESWWLVIGDGKSRQLYAIKKVNLGLESQSFNLEFTVPTKGKANLTVWCICDSYVDADKEVIMQHQVDALEKDLAQVQVDEKSEQEQLQQLHLKLTQTSTSTPKVSSTSNKNVLTPYIKSLLLDPPTLTPNDLASVLRIIFQGIPSEIQTSAFLSVLRLRGLDQEANYIAAAVSTVLEFAKRISEDQVSPHGYIDIVGTGGDGQNTFNVSTSSAIVAAGMGLPVCKHGGKASTSTSGSGDLLKCLGVDLTSINQDTTPEIVKQSNFCFLFAPSFHPGMGVVAHVRSQLGIPTIFNILGPLINPIPIQARVLGVYSEKLGESYAEAASILAKQSKIHKRTMVVFGEVVLDEISPIGFTKYWMVEQDGQITSGRISPKDFNLPEHDLSLVKSGTPEENAQVLLHILRQDKPEYIVKEQDNHPLVDYILMNSAALAVVAGLAKDWIHGVELAKKSIVSGDAINALEQFKQAINQVV